MQDEIILSVEGVSKKFCRNLRRSLWYGIKDSLQDLTGRSVQKDLRLDEFWAIKDVSFSLKRGECIGLIGHNGAGKTTLLKMLSGLIKPDAGRIDIKGHLGALIALGAGFNPVLSGRENLYVNGAILGLSKREIDEKYSDIVDFAGIGDFIEAPVQSYSSGMQVRLGFAIAVAVRPDILLLDEVLAVGDADFQAKCFNTLARFREEGTSFILVTHNAHQIARYCQSVVYLKGGRVEFAGDVEQGLALLDRDMSANSAVKSDEGLDWKTPRGTGQVQFTGGKFLDQNGDIIEEHDVGKPFTLALDYHRVDPSVSRVKLDLIIRDGDHTVFQGDSESFGQPLKLASSEGTIYVRFGSMAWNANRVHFFFSLFDPANHTVYDWKRNFRLDLRPQALSRGSVYVDTQWDVSCLSEQNI